MIAFPLSFHHPVLDRFSHAGHLPLTPITYMKAHWFILPFLFSATLGMGQKTTQQSLTKDFRKALGYWYGALTYLDYSSGEPYTMPADQELKLIPGSKDFVVFHIYPDEPKANGMDTLHISDDGQWINGEKVLSRKKLADGSIQIITTEQGSDGNDDRSATFRHTYTIGKTIFSKRKDVQFVGTEEWGKRHAYSYSRKPVPLPAH